MLPNRKAHFASCSPHVTPITSVPFRKNAFRSSVYALTMQQNQLELIISLCNSLGSMNDTERLLHDELGMMCSSEAESRLKSFSNSDGFLLTLMEVIRTPSVNLGSR